MLGRRAFEQLKAEYGAISEAKKGECFALRCLLQGVMSCLFFYLNQCYLVSRYIMTGDCSWAVVKVLCMGLGPQAKQQIREVAGGKVRVHVIFVLHR